MLSHWSVRALDLALAIPLTLLLAPLMLLVALAVRIDGPGPVVHREIRLGRDGHRFRLHKFRTLHCGHAGDSLVAPVGDPRITRVGRLLRPAHLDELPQLFHVLYGTMSLVGPRPARAELWDAVITDLRTRALAFRPGMTSPASLRFLCEDAVLARFPDPESLYRDIVFPAKVAEDVRYFESRTWVNDLGVVLRTPVLVALRRADAPCRWRLAHLLSDQRARSASGTSGPVA